MTDHVYGMGRFEGMDVRGLATDVVLPRRFQKSPTDPNVWLLLYEYDPGKMYHVRPGQDMLDTPSFMSCGIREAGSDILVGNLILLSEMVGSRRSFHPLHAARSKSTYGWGTQWQSWILVFPGRAGLLHPVQRLCKMGYGAGQDRRVVG